MDISELKDEQEMKNPCLALTCIDEPSRVGYPFAARRHGVERKVVLVEDDATNTVQYKYRYPDGHLGALESD